MAGYIQTSKAIDWRTPARIIEAVREFYGEIGLDPCANANPEYQFATRNFYLPDFDGLTEKWTGRVFVNPPYGRGIADWVSKAARSAEHDDAEVITLIPAAVDTKHWHDIIFRRAQSVLFFRRRLKFVGATASAPMACSLVYFGKHAAAFESHLDKFFRSHLSRNLR